MQFYFNGKNQICKYADFFEKISDWTKVIHAEIESYPHTVDN